MAERQAITSRGDVETIPGVAPNFRVRWDRTRLAALDRGQLAFAVDAVLSVSSPPDSRHRAPVDTERRALLLDAHPDERGPLLEELLDRTAMWHAGRSTFANERGRLNRRLRVVIGNVGEPAAPDAVAAALPGRMDWSPAWQTTAWSPPGWRDRVLLVTPEQSGAPEWAVCPEAGEPSEAEWSVIPQATLEQVVESVTEIEASVRP